MAVKFIDISIDIINKHFQRWTRVTHLPAARLMEEELATVVAKVIVDKPQDVVEEGSVEYFRSTVHEHTSDLVAFRDFAMQMAPACLLDKLNIPKSSFAHI